jgi:hypothetical protein
MLSSIKIGLKQMSYPKPSSQQGINEVKQLDDDLKRYKADLFQS